MQDKYKFDGAEDSELRNQMGVCRLGPSGSSWKIWVRTTLAISSRPGVRREEEASTT